MKNIFLIGMPGCGKTTIGKIVAQRLGVGFVDMDDVISRRLQKSINEIFAEYGEQYFRDVETSVLSELANKKNTVVSTGGGIVKSQKNRELLKDKTVVYIDADVEKIAARGNFSDRPLLKDNLNNLKNLYAERAAYYKECADIIVLGDGSPMAVAQRILSLVKD